MTARSDRRLLIYTAAALLVLALVALHTHHFRGRNYRQDEAWLVHMALENTLVENVRAGAIADHPVSWYILSDVWVTLAGDRESMTRFLSTLITALALALLFRLASDLFDTRTALLAVFLLGTSAFFQFHVHEFRPYSLLVMAVTGLQLALLRWLRRPDFQRALLVVGMGVLTINTHFFGFYALGALALAFVFLVRWDPGLYIRALGLLAAICLSFLGWLLPFLYVTLVVVGDGFNYSLTTSWESLAYLAERMQLNPAPLGTFLLLLGLTVTVGSLRAFTPVRPASVARLRFDPEWRKWYIVIFAASVLVAAFAINLVFQHVVPRSLIIILPSLALLLAFALRALPWQAQVIVVLLVTLPAVSYFRRFIANGPYTEIAAFMAETYQPGSPVVIAMPLVWQHVPVAYVVRTRLPQPVPNADLLHFMHGGQDNALNFMPDPPVNVIFDDSPASLSYLDAFVGSAEQVWYITGQNDEGFGHALLERLSEHFLTFRSANWTAEKDLYPYHYIAELRRIPENLSDQFIFGDLFALQSWRLTSSVEVKPCQTVTVESWWKTYDIPSDNYSLTLVLADSGGIGVARTDSEPANVLTGLWQPNQLYLDVRTVAVPCDASPGEYPLLTGLYDPDTQQQLPLRLADGTSLDGLAYLTTLFVRPE